MYNMRIPLASETIVDRYYQFGLWSYGIGDCSRQHEPAFYTRLQIFVDWIQKAVNEE